MNYREIRRATVWSYEFRRRIDGRVPPAEVTRSYEKLPIPTDLAIVQITLLVDEMRAMRVSISLLGSVGPSFQALSGHLQFTVPRHKFNTNSLSPRKGPGAQMLSLQSILREGRVVGP